MFSKCDTMTNPTLVKSLLLRARQLQCLSSRWTFSLHRMMAWPPCQYGHGAQRSTLKKVLRMPIIYTDPLKFVVEVWKQRERQKIGGFLMFTISNNVSYQTWLSRFTIVTQRWSECSLLSQAECLGHPLEPQWFDTRVLSCLKKNLLPS